MSRFLKRSEIFLFETQGLKIYVCKIVIGIAVFELIKHKYLFLYTTTHMYLS